MTLLVTGGAGYIGSAFVERCVAEGEPLVVIDDLSAGRREAVPSGVEFVRADVAERAVVAEVVRAHRVDACVHFASHLDVAESVADPLKYYDNNVVGALSLLTTLASNGVGRFVFSSSASVYGEAERCPIDERAPCAPVSPYGRSKRVVEEALLDLDRAGRMCSYSLRYFNAAGATRGSVERHDPETHLIPLALAAAMGERDALVIHGEDFPTRDGTAMRDYVHVADLADAHLRAVRALRGGARSDVLNLGSGEGTTVREVLRAVESATGRRVPHRVGPRRAGDVASLVAGITRARERLGWVPRRSEILTLVTSAWDAGAWPRRLAPRAGEQALGADPA